MLPIDEGFGYLLTTSQVVASKKYWDLIMTEPEMLSYTISHFKNDHNGTRMRHLMFEKYSTIDKAWMISDSCISLFDNVDKSSAREEAKKWWHEEGTYEPQASGVAKDQMDDKSYKNWKDYAVLEAGRARVALG